jgi:hypothetical protein
MKAKVRSCCWCEEWSLLVRLTEGLLLLTNGLVKRETGKPTSVVSGYYWRARLRTRDSARSRGSRAVSTHGLNTQRVSAVQKAWSSYVYATILLQHGPAACLSASPPLAELAVDLAGVFGPFHCSWLSDFRTPALKNLQKGMPPNRPTSLNNIILLKIDMFYDEAWRRLHSYAKTLFWLDLRFWCMPEGK